MQYPPPPYRSDDRQKMITLIKSCPFAALISTVNGEIFVTHIPIIYNQRIEKLVAHIDLYNPQVATLVDGAKVKVVFSGPDCYISPSVYSTDQLPTWNYMIVHVEGTVTRINDPEAAKQTMIDMTTFLEAPDHKFVLEADNPRMQRSVNYIQAFTIDITHWVGKFKLSQDKRKEDQRRARKAMETVSREMDQELITRIYE